MSEHEEQAYRNGYAKGYADAKKNEKHGRWETDEDDILFHCSVCDTQISTNWDYDDLSWNYCPNCGAIMDLPNITENTRKALEKMGENVHSEIDFDYAAED